MRFSWLLLFWLFLGCDKQQFSSVEVVGHAGNGLNIQNSIYQENTLQAIDLALGLNGVSGVEIDVQLSLDQQLWLYHDEKLEEATTASGCIASKNSEELATIRYKSANKEKLARLDELLFENYSGFTFYLDIRHFNACENQILNQAHFIAALQPIIDGNPNCNFVLITNYPNWLAGFKQQGWKTALNVFSIEELKTINWQNNPFDAVVLRNSNSTAEDVNWIKSQNKNVFLFDIRAPKTIRQAMKKQPNVVIVDDIKAALIEKT
ncbi:MAG: hypothetical protein E6Q89_08435 [Bacteroidia bacterium]|nr:MAG: hypothetical protein E6Q89_08435 [Bacteroidia bacterium]